jgi:predicted dehydrogenase
MAQQLALPIAKRHSELPGSGHIDDAQLVGVCDVVRARANAVASKFGVPAAYDIDSFLSQVEMDVVSVLTSERNASGARYLLCQGRQACYGEKNP